MGGSFSCTGAHCWAPGSTRTPPPRLPTCKHLSVAFKAAFPRWGWGTVVQGISLKDVEVVCRCVGAVGASPSRGGLRGLVAASPAHLGCVCIPSARKPRPQGQRPRSTSALPHALGRGGHPAESRQEMVLCHHSPPPLVCCLCSLSPNKDCVSADLGEHLPAVSVWHTAGTQQMRVPFCP